ncbi:Gfo/Idh/MocA family protein [Tabrizicola sp.]|uniref:Gfo/Idh/MocA family protein n=1 Tax=Tabrizicola sp. TaxID=2005166 RepID=UPI002736EEC3|nr:Gfo/Idh/MocA family oxidoreductase [Tabrizicola sp.]MDP3196883.1 Gfo/Idh/MocA family oxidoreductase [Tabrizicola sp.]
MIRYAVVGAGWISQEAFMPAVAVTGNSRMQAIVSGSPEVARQLADFHGVPEVVDYSGYDDLIASDRIDAVYIALPNSMHADYTIRALKAGKHVMVEKPLATSMSESEAMVAATRESTAFLMTAYRLHNEPGTHGMIEAIRSGKIGEPVFFTSTFGFQSLLGNHRLQANHWGGALPDVGVYCLNAARHVFAAEPIAVQAMASRPSGDPRFAEIDAGLAVTLRFPGDRLAQFFCSFGSGTSESIRVVGSSGELILDPAFKFDSALRLTVRADGKETIIPFQQVDHFSGQIAYFSDCILTRTPPEANGEEGLADMRALLAIDEAARCGSTVRLDPQSFKAGISTSMLRSFSPTTRRLLV